MWGKRREILKATGLVVPTAGCLRLQSDSEADNEGDGVDGSNSGDDATDTEEEIQVPEDFPEPVIHRFGLMSDKDAFNELNEGISHVSADSDAVIGAVFDTPVLESTVDYTTGVRIFRNGELIDVEGHSIEDTEDYYAHVDERTGWFEFLTDTWRQGMMEAKLEITDNHSGNTATQRFDFEFGDSGT